MQKSEYILRKRIKIARQAVITIREKKGIPEYSIITVTPKEWAIGLIGILDFVLSGDVDKILLRDVNEEIIKLVIRKNNDAK